MRIWPSIKLFSQISQMLNTVNSHSSGHCRDLKLVSSLPRVGYSESLVWLNVISKGKVKLQASAVSNLLLKRTWSVGWPQGPFAYLVTCVASHAGIFELIFEDLLLSESLRILAPSPSLPFCALVNMGVRWLFSTEVFQCDSASWQLHAGVVPTCRVTMDTFMLCLRHSGSRPTFKAPVLKLIYWQWV